MLVSDLVNAMERLAPSRYAEPWDNVGLLVGDPARQVAGPVLLTIDLSRAVAREAVEMNAAAVIAYHPPIFRPFKRLVTTPGQGEVIPMMIESRIAVYSPHTALDNAPGMLTDWLLEQCVTPDGKPPHGRFDDRAPLSPAAADDQPCKIVVFVPASPADVLDRVRSAMAAAGAGLIGNYDHCSFGSAGRGSFRGNEDSNPSVGAAGALEFVDEIRLEMICPARRVQAAIEAMRAAHPYEEPAFDVYPLAARTEAKAGGGRVAALDTPTELAEIASRVRTRLHAPIVQVAEADRRVTRLACVPGSGAALLDAALAAGADCFVTGEMKHHEVLAALDAGCSVILAGHTETERPFLKVLADKLWAQHGGANFVVSARDRSPLRGV